MPNGIDPVLLSVLVLLVSAVMLIYAQLRALNRRLTSLEKEYLALVVELEERLYHTSDRE